LVSEILLQQTNVEKIIQPYLKIIRAYRNINDLANANINFLRSIFKDIGLFYRADRLKNIAGEVVKNNKGLIPDKWEELIKINGIGYYICSTVLCFGYNQSYAVLDTNVIRIFDRLLDIKSIKKRPRDDVNLWKFAQTLLPEDRYVDYNYAILDFAASVCTKYKPKCSICIFNFMCFNVKLY
jgi:A/G-specific adenine glycosylase